MSSRITFLLLSLVLAMPSQAGSLPDTVDRIRAGVVAVGSYQATRRPPARFRGTGFAVGDGKLVVTNYHVLPLDLDFEHNEHLAVYSGRGKRSQMRKARVVAEDPLHDLAVLEVAGPPMPAFVLGDSNGIREGEEIAFTGFPLGMVLGLYPVTHRGIVAAITPIVIPQTNSKQLTVKLIKAMRDPYEVLQLDAVAYPGNSGSPVYDQSSGQLIGVINSVLVKGTKESALEHPTGITYAIPLKFLKPLVAEAERKRAQK